jgi:glutamate-5-semialdehyde dehydrogenase
MSVSDASPREVAEAASTAARSIAILPAQARNDALTAIHQSLSSAKEGILAANARDVATATKAAADGTLKQSILKRLDLSRPGKWEDMLQGILDVRNLEEPVGKTTLKTKLDDGLVLERVTAPLGVLLIIFEARPEVIANIAALAIKSGNAAILKGGKESTESFVAIATVISAALAQTSVPNAAIQLVTTRDVIPQLLALDQFVDLVIPRGSNELVTYIKNNTKIPVLGHADGLCSTYLCADADTDTAVRLVLDSKLGYPAACNALETLLVDEAALSTVLPAVAKALVEQGVELRCDAFSKAALSSALQPDQAAKLVSANPADFDTEFLDLVLAIHTIPAAPSPEASVDLAVAHINAHSSKHTDAIITKSQSAARRFQLGVDSAGVYWNASTRFADGMRYGFGTEVGVSTNKIHARGPVGLEGLMSYKYLVYGSGQVASDYGAGDGKRKYMHEALPLS